MRKITMEKRYAKIILEGIANVGTIENPEYNEYGIWDGNKFGIGTNILLVPNKLQDNRILDAACKYVEETEGLTTHFKVKLVPVDFNI